MPRTVTASSARAELGGLLYETAESNEPILITGKRSNAVLVSEQDWRPIQETLYLLSIPGVRKSIREGMNTPLAKCKQTLRW